MVPQERPDLFGLRHPIKESPWPLNYDPVPKVRAMLNERRDISYVIEHFGLKTKDEPGDLRPGELVQFLTPEFREKEFRLGLSDDRILAGRVRGKPGGRPLLLIPGMPSSRFGDISSTYELDHQCCALYTIDGPGYGSSDRLVGRTVASTAADVRELADAFEIEKFEVIVGRSGGGPKALACTDLARQIITLGAPAPIDADIPNRRSKLGASNALDTSLNTEDNIKMLEERAANLIIDPFSLLRLISKDFTIADWHILSNRLNLDLIAASHYIAVQKGPWGLIDDELAINRNPWDFNLKSIKIPENGIQLWTEEDDRFTPTECTEWLGTQIKGAEVCKSAYFSHFTGMDLIPFLKAYVRFLYSGTLLPNE